MLRYSFGLERQATAIEAAVRKTLDAPDLGGYGVWTKDLGGEAKTTDVTDKVLECLDALLKTSK
jgi:3-isopropylmalate dehydrogenase